MNAEATVIKTFLAEQKLTVMELTVGVSDLC
jgi:hypothetical protein